MNRRAFLCSLLGLAVVAALPTSNDAAAQPRAEPALEPVEDASADLPAVEAADAQYYRRRRVYRRRVYRRHVYRRRIYYRRPVYYRPVRRVYYRRRIYYRPVRRVYYRRRVRRVYW